MALINTSVPNLIQGVSQQPDASRFAGQCEEQENALSSVADGLKKRPNTRHIAKLLTTAIDSNSFVHFINRSDSEKYVIIIYKEYDSSGVHTGCKMRAFNVLDGTEQPINSVTGGYTISDTQFAYLHTASPKDALKALTIADSTFLLNTEIAVGIGTETSPSTADEALIFIKQSDYEKKYGFKASMTTGGGLAATFLKSNVIAQNNPKQYRLGSLTMPEYSPNGVYHYVDSNGNPYYQGGSGFAAGDIVNINLPPTYTDTFTDDDDVDFSNTFPLNLLVQPTIKVLTVNSVGTILTFEIENAGRWTYGTTYSGYNGIYNGVATSAISTNNTAVSGTASVSLFKSWKTIKASGTSAGAKIGSSYILNKLALLTSAANGDTGEEGASSGAAWSTYFTADASATSENVLVLKDIKNTDGTSKFSNLSVGAIDDLAGAGIGVVYKEVNSIVDLPLVAKNGFEVKVAGDAELNQDDYYVRFETTGGVDIGQGSWVECVAPELRLGYNANTLPVELISDGTGFTLRTMKFADRVAGDENSNPLASFVAQTIDNLFFFKNRLGFLCGENVVMSESGLGALDTTGQLNFNFGRTTVTTLLDSDPIDVSVASSRVTNLKSAKGFQENLILFSENGQFVLKGGAVLTPKTVSITPITNFSFEDQVDPLPLGSYIYFPFTRGAFTGMREFTVNASTDNYDSTEVTEHVPAYIPKNIIDMAGTTSEDMIVLLSGDEKGSLYVYNYFWNNNQKVLSAWSKFTFTGEIRGIEFIESTLYAVITNNGETNLVEMPLESGLTDTAGYVTHLDMRVAKTVTHGSSTITLPYTPADNSVEVYTTDGLKLNATNSGATVTLTQAVNDVDINGNDIDTPVFVGIPYTMKYTFSEQLFKAKSGNGTSPSNAAKLLIRNGSIYFDKTAFFKVKVTPKFRDTYENIFTPDVVGSTTIGTLNLDSGFYRFPVLTKAQDTTITIENGSALPSTFQSAEFESFVHTRSNRYG
tara:strand:- start:6 stop:2963 length:2958 start_codon:yes stop_codon:yes gene_type:complete